MQNNSIIHNQAAPPTSEVQNAIPEPHEENSILAPKSWFHMIFSWLPTFFFDQSTTEIDTVVNVNGDNQDTVIEVAGAA